MQIVLFDIDGTLISTGGAGRAALEDAMAQEFGVVAQIPPLLLSGRTDRAIMRDLFQIHAIEDKENQRERLTRSYLEHLPAHLRRQPGQLLPGVLDFIQHLLARSDVLLGLLTGNSQQGAQVKLRHFSLDQHFVCGGFGDDCLDRDEVAQKALTAARNHLPSGQTMDRVWVIGDTPLDIRCARKIQAEAVAVATGWHSMEELQEHRPSYLLADLSQAVENLAPLMR